MSDDFDLTLGAARPGLSQVDFAIGSPPEANGQWTWLAACAWDGRVRFFRVAEDAAKAAGSSEPPVIFEAGEPVLCVVWVSSTACVVGTLEGRVLHLVLSQDSTPAAVVAGKGLSWSVESKELGRHEAGKGARALAFSKARPSWILSGGWDETVRVWDFSEGVRSRQVHLLKQPSRVFALSTTDSGLLVVGTAGRHIWVWDLTSDLAQPKQRRESSLEYQTRSVACSVDGAFYAVASVAGRVAIEFIDQASQSKQYAFKCHRKTIDGVDTIFPVNSLAFHPGYGTFATGGSDGSVFLWDAAHKKRLAAYQNYEAGVADLAFSHDGKTIAIASAYTFEGGEREAPNDRLVLRSVGEEAQPRSRSRR